MIVGGRAGAVLVAAVVALALTGAPARAAPPPPVPADVLAVFQGEALRQAEAGGDGVDTDFSGAQVAAVHEVHAFSDAFIRGRATTEPLIARGQWLGALVRSDEVLGTLGVWRDGGGPPQPNGFSNDVGTGRALLTLTAAEMLVLDEPHGASYAVDGATVRPLDEWARRILPEPGPLARLQPAVAAQYAEMRDQTAPEESATPGLAIALVGMAVALLVGGALVVARRRRRPAG